MVVGRTRFAGVVGAALVASAAIGLGISASGGEGGGSDAPPGLPYQDLGDGTVAAGPSSRKITTGGTNYDPTILTKFIPGSGFQTRQGENLEADLTNHVFSGTCVFPSFSSAGTLTELRASVELPDGARIKRVIVFVEDSDAANDILFQLKRTMFTPPLPAPGLTTTTDETVTQFTTEGFSGVAIVTSPDLAEVTGSVAGGPGVAVDHRFHSLYAQLQNSSGINHKLCGAEIEYQVPISAKDPGTVFHAIDPVRAFDSRIASLPGSGLLRRNTSRLISVKDGRNLDGVVIAPDVVPAGATAVAYNIAIAGQTGPNFVAVTPGGATSFATAAINFSATGDLSNSAIVGIDAQRRIKVWGGGGAGSTHVIIDITGYFAPPRDPPNMGN